MLLRKWKHSSLWILVCRGSETTKSITDLWRDPVLRTRKTIPPKISKNLCENRICPSFAGGSGTNETNCVIPLGIVGIVRLKRSTSYWQSWRRKKPSIDFLNRPGPRLTRCHSSRDDSRTAPDDCDRSLSLNVMIYQWVRWQDISESLRQLRTKMIHWNKPILPSLQAYRRYWKLVSSCRPQAWITQCFIPRRKSQRHQWGFVGWKSCHVRLGDWLTHIAKEKLSSTRQPGLFHGWPFCRRAVHFADSWLIGCHAYQTAITNQRNGCRPQSPSLKLLHIEIWRRPVSTSIQDG